MSLLETAKKAKTTRAHRKYLLNDDTLELALAYLNAEINATQVESAGVCSRQAANLWSSCILRWAIREGKAIAKVT